MTDQAKTTEASIVWKIELTSEVYDKSALEGALLSCNRLIVNAIWGILDVKLPNLLEGKYREDFNIKLSTYTENWGPND